MLSKKEQELSKFVGNLNLSEQKLEEIIILLRKMFQKNNWITTWPKLALLYSRAFLFFSNNFYNRQSIFKLFIV